MLQLSAAAIQRSAKISAKCQIKQALNYSKTTTLQSGTDVRSATIFSHQDTIIVKVRNEPNLNAGVSRLLPKKM